MVFLALWKLQIRHLINSLFWPDSMNFNKSQAKKNINRFFTKIASLKYFLPFDVYERHRMVSRFIPENTSILDVGGALSLLEKFCPTNLITTCDVVRPANIIYDGKKIPLGKESNQIVTSIDTLEHVPQEQRLEFIGELVRVAQKLIIISAPLGTNLHGEIERKTYSDFQKNGLEVPYLAEHIKNGLPTIPELQIYLTKLDIKSFRFLYSGNIYVINMLFRFNLWETKIFALDLGLLVAKTLLNFFYNLFLYPFSANDKFTERTNRFYLILKKV